MSFSIRGTTTAGETAAMILASSAASMVDRPKKMGANKVMVIISILAG